MTTGRKLLLLGALYAAQGLPYGFFSQVVPVALRQGGVSLEGIGLANLLALPWALKWLWAPAVERTGTPRRWVLSLQAVAVALCVLLALQDPGDGLRWLLAAVLLTNLAAATQDVATDGLAVSLLGPEERGWGNGLQVAGYRAGMIVGGGALLVAWEAVGWWWTLLALGAAVALCSGPLLASPDVGRAQLGGGEREGLGWDWLRRDGALAWVGLLVAFKGGDYLVQGMLRPWLVDAGWTAGDLGVLLGGGGFVAGLIGAALGGVLVNPLGRARALVVFGAAQAMSLALYAVAASQGAPAGAVWTAVIAEHLLGGMATVALFTAMMDACRAERGATDYTLQASVVVVASGVAAGLSGGVAARVGYEATFTAGALLACLAPALAAWPRMRRVLEAP